MRRPLPQIQDALALIAGLLPLRPPAAQVEPKSRFAITVSTEWAPGSLDRLPADLAAAGCPAEGEATMLADLERGLRSMAAQFYRFTGGQLAIDSISIYTGGEQWEQANIRVLASRSYRPSAFVGGAAAAPTAYYSATGSLEPMALFYPAPVLLGRQWDGRGGRCGPWSAPEGWRTIAHEWGHHALYLYDEYLQQGAGREQFCGADGPGFRLLRRGERAPADTGSSVASLMAYHYTADQLSLWEPGAPPPACRDTPQTAAHGASAWATVERIYEADGVTAPPALAPGPSEPPPVAVTVVLPAAARERSSAAATLAALPGPPLVGQAYLIRPRPDGGAPQRIIGQGAIVAGEALPMQLVGVQPDTGDRAAVMAPDPVGGALYSFPADYRTLTGADGLRTDAVNSLGATESGWRVSLGVRPLLYQGPGEQFSRVSGLEARLEECGEKPPTAVEFVYCPAGGECGAPALVQTPAGDGSFSHTFFFDEQAPAAPHGYIYAREPFRGAEAVTWYQLGGGVGPAHTGGHAPIAEGLLSLEMAGPDQRAPTSDNRALFAPALACGASGPLPPGVTGLLGPALAIRPVIADPNNGASWGQGRPPLRVRLSYDQDLLDRLGIAEARLLALRRNGQGLWEIAPAVGRSAALDWIAAAPQSFSNQGEVYVLGYGPAGLWLPIVR
jgi:hypothetical protein